MEKWLIGVDIGGTTTKIALISYYGEIVDKWEIQTDHREEGKYITVNIAKSIDQKLDEHGIVKEQVLGIGAGAPGPVNLENGVLYNTPNLGWHDHYPLRDLLEVETSLPVMINNDANCAALGEMWKGAGDGAKDLVCVTLGTGVGGGIITNGQIVQGIRGAAGEIGHITAVAEGGAACNCGKTGCLETVSSATGIVRIAKEKLQNASEVSLLNDPDMMTAKQVFDAAKENDFVAKSVIQDVAFYLGYALANIANTLNPEKIVLGGGVSKAGDILLQPVMENFKKFAFSSVATSTEITFAKLGNDAGVIGAAWLIKNK